MEVLLDRLKERCKNKQIRFTKGIDFTYDDKEKVVHIFMKKGIKENMQDDSAAFEGWALTIKANLYDLVDSITLDWDPEMEPVKKNSVEWRHFNRFLYRVYKFSKAYSEWFKVCDERKSWKELIIEKQLDRLVLNSPGNRKIVDDIDEQDNTNEHKIEVIFTKEGSKNLEQAVGQQFNIKLGEIKNQYPVGIFNNEVNGENYIFTGGKSAIDLYSIAGDDSFNIFELKGAGNVKVGILSELFFYSSLIKDVIDGNFISESGEIKKLSKVNAFFLVQRIHPLISDKVIKMLNLYDSNISYEKLIYNISNNDISIE